MHVEREPAVHPSGHCARYAAPCDFSIQDIVFKALPAPFYSERFLACPKSISPYAVYLILASMILYVKQTQCSMREAYNLYVPFTLQLLWIKATYLIHNHILFYLLFIYSIYLLEIFQVLVHVHLRFDVLQIVNIKRGRLII